MGVVGAAGVFDDRWDRSADVGESCRIDLGRCVQRRVLQDEYMDAADMGDS